MNSLNTPTDETGPVNYPHFTDEETKALRGQVVK